MLAHLPEHFWTVPLSIFVAGLIASPHCAFMCGPLALGFAQNKWRMVLYQAGRMIAYVFAGTIAGWIGASLLRNLVSPYAMLAIAALALSLLFMGLQSFIAGNKIASFHIPFLSKLSTFASRKILRLQLPKEIVSFLAGMTTVLLPCGHLYGFLLGASATGSPIKGGLFMFAFWLSTLPALAIGPIFIRKLTETTLGKSKHLAGIILIAASLFSVVSFANQLKRQTAEPGVIETQSSDTSAHHHCH